MEGVDAKWVQSKRGLRNLTIGSCNLDLPFLRSFQNFRSLQPYPGHGCLLSFHDWM